MKIALWSGALAYFQRSMTHLQLPPDGFAYVRPGDPEADILMATHEDPHWLERMLRDAAGDQRPKVLWRQEARWLMPRTVAADAFLSLDVVLSSDALDPGAIYLPFAGTWIRGEPDLEKDFMVSMIASDKENALAEGYSVRRWASDLLGGKQWDHGYGNRFRRPIEDKTDALAPYRFSVAIESQSYPWYHTEKLFDCFACKTVPLYWGCQDFTRLAEWGYDPTGILPWTTPDELAHLVGSLSVERYESMQAAIHANYERTKELYCTEVALMKVLEGALCLGSRSS